MSPPAAIVCVHNMTIKSNEFVRVWRSLCRTRGLSLSPASTFPLQRAPNSKEFCRNAPTLSAFLLGFYAFSRSIYKMQTHTVLYTHTFTRKSTPIDAFEANTIFMDRKLLDAPDLKPRAARASRAALIEAYLAVRWMQGQPNIAATKSYKLYQLFRWNRFLQI